MNNKLKNIFVPYNVAKLAFEKGFTDWCAGINNKLNQVISNCESDDFKFDFEYITDDNDGEYGIPTHFQLIDWLKDKHNIDVLNCQFPLNGLYKVLDSNGYYGKNEEFDTEFEINQALEVALNLLPNFQHDKQEYL